MTFNKTKTGPSNLDNGLTEEATLAEINNKKTLEERDMENMLNLNKEADVEATLEEINNEVIVKEEI